MAIVALMLCTVATALAQHTVSGTVTDLNGEPLQGVAVIVKNSPAPTGTVTDVKGVYSISVQSDALLEFTSLGYHPFTVQVNGREKINIVLQEDNELLDEIVVVGFATQKKENLTGAVSTLGSEEIESVPVHNPILALQGQIPGLTITQNSGQLYNNGPSMELRGLTTIGQGSSGAVLVLIDGMEGDLSTLNAQDIESISVLKDAAASSIYGSRAPFGVILVTTKTGRKGKAQVNYNNNFRFKTPINMPKVADSYSWALYFNEASNNDGNGDDIGPERLQRIKDYMDGKISYNTIPVEGGQWGTAYTEGNDNIDYYDVFYKDLTTAQEHNLSINGGTDIVNYYVSANYINEKGVLNWDLDGLQRLNIFGKFEARPFKFMKIGYSSRYMREWYHQPTYMNDTSFQYFGQYLWPVAPLYDPNGILFNDVVLQYREGGQMNISNTTFTQQFNVEVTPLPGWRIVGDVNYRHRDYFNRVVSIPVHQTCVDGVTPGSVWNPQSSVAEDAGRNEFITVNLYSDYEKTFLGGHYFKVMAGFQSEIYNDKTVYAQKAGLIVPDIPTINTASGLYNGEQIPPNVSGGYGSWKTAGFFGRINYNFKERYLVEANLRYDGSSRFRRNNRWGFFPSFSAGWNIANEPFFRKAKEYVNMLKVRASYGSLGNQNTSNWYPTYQAMGFANSSGTWLINGQKTNIAWPPELISMSLTWEKIRTWNVGLDFAAFDSRLSGSFEYFVRQTMDMIGPADELPAILGTSVPETNNTDLETRGWEMEISWRDQAFGQLNYGVRLVLSDAQGTITRYSNPSGSLDQYYSGKKWGEIWGYETIGIAQTDQQMLDHLATLPNGGQDVLGNNWQAGDIMYRDVNGDGAVDNGANTISDHGDLVVIGNTTPRYNFGIDLTAEWKGIDVRIFLQGVGKRDYFQRSKYFFGSRGWDKWGTMVLVPHLDYFRDDSEDPLGVNMDAYYPRPYFLTEKNVQVQTRYLQNAAYCRLKNVQIGYTIPQKYTGRIGISNLRIYLSGENLATITNMTRLFDPETIGSNDQGNVYPLTKTYSVGLSVTF